MTKFGVLARTVPGRAELGSGPGAIVQTVQGRGRSPNNSSDYRELHTSEGGVCVAMAVGKRSIKSD